MRNHHQPQLAGKSRSGRLQRLLRDNSGNCVIEFTFVILPTMALIMGTIETSFVFFSNQTLQTATAAAARTLMTGSMQTKNATLVNGQPKTQAQKTADFQKQICGDATASPVIPNALPSYMSCDNMFFKVQTVTSLTGTPPARPTDATPDINGSVNYLSSYAPGSQSSFMVVQVFYVLPVVPGALGSGLANITNNRRMLTATAVIKAEPYA